MTADDLIDAVVDLQHDLGKYLRLPISMLPVDATPEAVRAAASEALLQTRRGPSGVTPAAEIWAAFVEEVAGALDQRPEFRRLSCAVAQALAHTGATDSADPEELRADLGAVGPAIRALARGLSRG